MMSLSRTLITLAALLLVTAVSCDRYLDSRVPDADQAPLDGPVTTGLRAYVNDGAVLLTWQLASGSAQQYRIYRADSDAGNFIVYDSTGALQIALTDLRINHDYYFRVAAVAANHQEGPRSDIVAARAARLSVTIGDGAVYTNSRQVAVHVAAPEGTTNMMLSEDRTFAGSTWETFASPKDMALSSGDGVKTVYARLQFGDGSLSGDTLSDDIVLDTYAAIASVSFSPSATSFAPGETITFTLDADESGGEASVSFTGTAPVMLFDDGATGGDITEDDGVYTGRFVVPAGFYLANGLVTGSFTDAAGNQALAMTSSSVLNIQSPPIAPVLGAVAMSTYEIYLSWSGSNDPGFAAYQAYRNTSSNVSTNSTLLATLTSATEVSFTDTTLGAGTTYYYRVYAVNSAGQMSGSEVASATTPANTTPAAVTLTAVLSGANEVQLDWTASPEIDFAAYEVYWNTSAGVSPSSARLVVIGEVGTVGYSHYLASGTTRFYRMYVRDRHGALSAGSNEVSVSAP